MALTIPVHETDDPLLGRIVAEYREMPGLCLTTGQAARLWGMSVTDADRILRELMSAGFLRRTPAGSYVMRGD